MVLRKLLELTGRMQEYVLNLLAGTSAASFLVAAVNNAANYLDATFRLRKGINNPDDIRNRLGVSWSDRLFTNPGLHLALRQYEKLSSPSG